MNTTQISKTRFFSNEAVNFDFANMVKKNQKLKTFFKNSEDLKEFFGKCINDENKNEDFYMFISKYFPGHQERVAEIFQKHGAVTTIADMASVLVYNENSEIFIVNRGRTDGINTVAVFDEKDNIRLHHFMKTSDTLIKGHFDISASDCRKEPTGLQLNGIYEVYTVSTDDYEFIAFKKIAD